MTIDHWLLTNSQSFVSSFLASFNGRNECLRVYILSLAYMSELRKNILDEARRVVVKIGSRILVDSERGGVRTRYIQKLADSVARLMDAGKEVVVVTSGAVGTGMAELGYKQKPTVLAEKQA